MNQKTLLVLGAVTLAAVGGAAFKLRATDKAQASASQHGPLFPELRSKVNSVARITLRQGEDELEVSLEEGDWVLSGKGGYPAKFEKAKETVLQVANLEIDEVKTANPAYFDKLGVQDPGPDLPSRQVTLFDTEGQTLAAVVIGNTPQRARDAAFVRRGGEDQVYQTKGRVTASTRLNDWTDRDILKIPKDRVAEVIIEHPADEEHPEPERVEIALDPLDPTGKSMVVGVPADRELTYATVGDAVLGALASLQFDDVAPAQEVEFPADQTTTATFHCKDGLVLAFDLIDRDGTWWTKLSASFDEGRVEVPELPEAAPSDALLSQEDGSGPKSEEADPGAGSEETAADPQAETEVAEREAERRAQIEALLESGRAEAEELNSQHAPWAYALPTYRATNLTKRMEDLLKPLPDPEAAADAAVGGAPGDQLSQEELQQLLEGAGINPEELMQAGGSTDDG